MQPAADHSQADAYEQLQLDVRKQSSKERYLISRHVVIIVCVVAFCAVIIAVGAALAVVYLVNPQGQATFQMEPPIGRPQNTGRCPVGFIGNESLAACFLFANFPKNWAQARQHCLDMDAFLAELDNEKKLDFVRILFEKFYDVEQYWYVWVGGRKEDDGQWVWDLSGLPVSKSSPPWIAGHPDDPNATRLSFTAHSRGTTFGETSWEFGLHDFDKSSTCEILCETKMQRSTAPPQTL